MGKVLKRLSRLNKKGKGLLLPVVLYFLFSLVFTYPLVLDLYKTLPGWPMDGFIYLWNIDTFWYELSSLSSPFFTERVFYPIGANLVFHTYAPLVSILGVFALNNLVFFMNLVILFSLTFGGLTMFVLIKHLSKDYLLSLISGLVFAFSPIMVSYITSQHYYFAIASSFLPIAAFLVIRFLETAKYNYLVFLFLVFWAVFLTDYYITVLLILLTVTLFATSLLRKEVRKRVFKKRVVLSSVFILFSTIVLPASILFTTVFKLKDFSGWMKKDNYYASYCNTNLARFVLPSDSNPLLGTFRETIRSRSAQPTFLDIDYDTPSYFLGWGILLLGVLAGIRTSKLKWSKSLILFGIVVFLLSLGPKLKIANRVFDLRNLSPFDAFSQLPFMNLIDCPKRMVVGIQFTLASIIAIGFSQQIKGKSKKTKRAVSLLIFFIFIIEYLTFNIPVHDMEIPKVYKDIAKIKDSRTVLEIPSGITESKSGFGYDWSIRALHSKQLYWQTNHNKPRVGGYLSRVPDQTFNYFKSEPVISDLFEMSSLNGTWSGNEYSSEEISNFIKEFGIGYIVLSPNPRKETFSGVIESLFGNYISQKKEKEGFVLYKLYSESRD